MTSGSNGMSDLIAVGPHHQHIIVGFFTPNYQELAEQFAANLSALGEPYHLYAIAPSEWKGATLMKPTIVQKAMQDYPLRTVILMDVDCALSASLGYHAEGMADVAFHIRAGKGGKAKVSSSSRVVIFRPTDKAAQLAEAWREACAEPKAPNDEAQLMVACARTQGLIIEQIPKATEPGEWATAHHPHVRHVSAHTEHLGHNLRKSRLQRWRRQIYSKVLGQDYVTWKYGEQG